MDVREKLVELLSEKCMETCKQRKGCVCSVEECKRSKEKCCGFYADHLIANGVTVQEWILVDDMLPKIPEGWAETPEPVLYMMKNTKTIYAGYYGEGGVWKNKYFRQYADSRNGIDADDVLCWMYQHDLPQPPKGE